MKTQFYKDRTNPDPMETIEAIESEMEWLKSLVGQKSLVEQLLPLLKFDEEAFKKSALEFSEMITAFLFSESGQRIKNGNAPTEEDNKILKQIYPYHISSWDFLTHANFTVKNHRLDRFVENFLYGIPSTRWKEFAELLGIKMRESPCVTVMNVDYRSAIEKTLKKMLPYEERKNSSNIFTHGSGGGCRNPGGIH